ncbi:transcriptional regulator [Lachnoclostridium sp. An196]|nr:transcriptional regulator [Lachnoclostridium sp. An196]
MRRRLTEEVNDLQNQTKQDQILDALQTLLGDKNIQNISVSEIAQTAGIGKGSIYYYFPSKDSIVDALVERNYEKPLETAKNLAKQTSISPFTRMAMIFQACRNSSTEFRAQDETKTSDAKEDAFIRQKYMKHLISEMKPVLTEIIRQGIEQGEIHFDYPAALAEIVLIVLTVKLDNSLVPSDPGKIEETILGLISLLEKGTENPAGSLNFLMMK